MALDRIVLGDAWQYRHLAANLLAGHGYSHSDAPPWQPDCVRSPAYVLFLLPFHALRIGATGIVLAQVALDACLIVLIYRRVARHFSAGTAWCAAALYAGSVFEAAFCVQTLAECLATFLMAGWAESSLRVLERPTVGRWAGCGAMAASMALCRPELLVVAIVGLGGVAGCARQVRGPAIAAAVLVALLMPYAIRNGQVGGRFLPTPLAVGGTILWQGVASDASPPLTSEGWTAYRKYQTQWGGETDLSPDEAMAADRELGDIAWRTLRQQPLAYARLLVSQAVRLWWWPQGTVENLSNAADPSTAVFVQDAASWTQHALIVLALVGIATGRAPLCRLLWPVALIALLTAMHAPFHVEGRYMLPAQPGLCLMAAVTLMGGRVRA